MAQVNCSIREQLEILVDDVDDPALNWAWELTEGVLFLHAHLSQDSFEDFDAAHESSWAMFRDAWNPEALVHHTIAGLVTDMIAACPGDEKERMLQTVKCANNPPTNPRPERPRLRLIVTQE